MTDRPIGGGDDRPNGSISAIIHTSGSGAECWGGTHDFSQLRPRDLGALDPSFPVARQLRAMTARRTVGIPELVSVAQRTFDAEMVTPTHVADEVRGLLATPGKHVVQLRLNAAAAARYGVRLTAFVAAIEQLVAGSGGTVRAWRFASVSPRVSPPRVPQRGSLRHRSPAMRRVTDIPSRPPFAGIHHL